MQKYTFQILILFLGLTLITGELLGQVSGIRWLRVGDLHSWYSSDGAEIEIGRTGGLDEQLDGLRWEAQFRFQDAEVAKGLWIGTSNYEDPLVDNTFYSHKVIGAGPRSSDPVGTMIPYDFRMIGRFEAPLVIVDGDIASDNQFDDQLDEIDPDLIPDRMIINRLNTSVGIHIERKISAFSQQNHNNYFVYEYVFKNDGVIDGDGTVVEKTLTDVMFFFQYRYAFGLEAFRCVGCGWAPNNSITWGYNTVNQAIGMDPDASDFEMRAQYSWYGRHSRSNFASLGAPHRNGDGHFAAPQFAGVTTLHADTSPDDQTDDLSQPSTTHHVGSDGGPNANDQFNATLMTSKYNQMTLGHANPTHADDVGDGFADQYSGSEFGGYAQGQGFGPYTLEPGDSIRIVLAEGVSGLRRQDSYDIGAEWLNGLDGGQTSFTMPDGSITDDPDEYKDAWVMTGEDSLLNTFRRAHDSFENDFDIPQPPPPPSVFEVTSGGDQIILSWSNTAESWSNFNGYRLYRAIEKPDTTFELIFECDLSNLVNEYRDRDARRGFEYYYYIESVDDGSTNDIQPGVPMVSSKFYTMTNRPAFLRKPASTALDDIRVVPNPYNISARSIQFGTEGGADQLAFFGLPPECTIKIYTERGDLVETLIHDDGSGDEIWRSLTSSEQIIVSGVYIAYFEVTRDVVDEETGETLLQEGESTFRKFIIIR